MLVVKVEIWPGGEADRAVEISRIGISNTSRTLAVADYDMVALLARDAEEEVVKGRITGHERDLGWAPLVRRALLNLFYGEDAVRGIAYDDPTAELLRKG